MLKKREDHERVMTFEKRRGGKKGLRMSKKRGEDKERIEKRREERVKNVEEKRIQRNG
jgi:hypothetical protein